MSNSFLSRRRFVGGFSLTEMLVVIAVISTLLAISLPALTSVRDNARTTACASNLRQIGIALNTYEKEFRTFPPGQADPANGSQGKWLWPVFLLANLEQVALSKKIDLKKGPFEQALDDTRTTVDLSAQYPLNVVLPFFICPGAGRTEDTRSPDNRLPPANNNLRAVLGCMDYVGIRGPATTQTIYGTNDRYLENQGVLLITKGTARSGPQEANPRVSLKQIRDGLGKTILLSECTGRARRLNPTPQSSHGAWAVADDGSLVEIKSNRGINSPANNADWSAGQTKTWEVAWANDQLYSEHGGGGVNTVFCDTSVQFLRDTLDRQLLCALASRASGERVQPGPNSGEWVWDPNQN